MSAVSFQLCYLWVLMMEKNTCKEHVFVMCHLSFQPPMLVGVRRYASSIVNFNFVAYSFTQPSGGSIDVACEVKTFCVRFM